jgi:hypothetical protein
MSKEKFSFKDEIKALSDIVTGEEGLRKKEEGIANKKEEAKQRVKTERKRKIIEKEVVLEKEEDVEKRKVVQNIKVFEWEAPERVKIKFDNRSYLILVGASLLLILLLAVLGHYGLMAAIISLLFLIYVWGTTEPAMVKHKITARGIDLGSKLYEWYMLESFYFTKKGDQLFLFVDTKLRYPPSLIFLLEKGDKDPLFVIFQDKLLYKDIRKQSRLSKLAYGEYITLEEV